MLTRESPKSLATVLRHRVTVQTLSETADGEGGFSQTWTDTAYVWASIEPLRANRQFEYRSQNVEATHMIRVRGDVSISESQRIKHGSRYFEILTVEDIQERGIYKVIIANEKR